MPGAAMSRMFANIFCSISGASPNAEFKVNGLGSFYFSSSVDRFGGGLAVFLM